jgi:hypothetical protein
MVSRKQHGRSYKGTRPTVNLRNQRSQVRILSGALQSGPTFRLFKRSVPTPIEIERARQHPFGHACRLG